MSGGRRDARADLLDVAQGRRAWSSPLGRAAVTASPPRRSAVLLLFGLADGAGSPAAARVPAPDDVDLLLTRRSDALRHHPGQIAFPGGGLDPGESPAQAAVREAVEETGLEPGGVEVLGALADVPVVVSGNVVTPVLGWWRAPSPLVPDGVETAEAFRVPVRDLLDPAARVTVAFRHTRGGTGAVHRGPGFQVEHRLVWGFTAFVLDAVLDSLAWTVPWDRSREVEL
ncbi:NUDIX hydrolase [Litorihabitans aurantiacus]|uniref:Coenzyme A pyrophosphatase n=1 Tax=Litorihabitans aurantiacus TaxID=1930061 RepID=A0AA37XDZ1_9MICO|nr:CoA pyrophosphatase [Litorihabitans aurantiacus]GMA31427.1 coenzyme A pyrophosphatase [Litorihabitans aurantiacus]